MEPRKYQVGDRLRDWQGRVGTVDRAQTIINEVAPHHRVRISYGDFGYSEGAEYNFHPAEFWQVWEGETLRANQATREGAGYYMRPGRILVGPVRVSGYFYE